MHFLIHCGRFLFFSLLLSGPIALGAETPNFSGTYVLTRTTGDMEVKKSTIWTLQVVQADGKLEIIRLYEDGRKNVSTFFLNTGEGVYMSPGGIAGKGKAQFKGKRLFLDSVIVTHPHTSESPVPLHIRERWELSADSKTLTIRRDVELPGMTIFRLSGSETYARK